MPMTRQEIEAKRREAEQRYGGFKPAQRIASARRDCDNAHGRPKTRRDHVREANRGAGKADPARVQAMVDAGFGNHRAEFAVAQQLDLNIPVPEVVIASPTRPVKRDYSSISGVGRGRSGVHYALEGRGKDSIEYFEVKDGRVPGFKFVNRLLGAPGDWRKVKLPMAEQMQILDLILDDEFVDTEREGGAVTLHGAEAAMVRYGREHMQCAACRSPLSLDESKARAMGEHCWKKRFGGTK